MGKMLIGSVLLASFVWASLAQAPWLQGCPPRRGCEWEWWPVLIGYGFLAAPGALLVFLGSAERDWEAWAALTIGIIGASLFAYLSVQGFSSINVVALFLLYGLPAGLMLWTAWQAPHLHGLRPLTGVLLLTLLVLALLSTDRSPLVNGAFFSLGVAVGGLAAAAYNAISPKAFAFFRSLSTADAAPSAEPRRPARCERCGRRNPPSAAFCGNCGSALAAAMSA